MRLSTFAALVVFAVPGVALGFVATSTNFFVRGSMSAIAGSTTSPYSTSTNFQVLPAGGGTAVGTSSTANYVVRSGFLNGLKTETKPVYDQIQYHWRNDDGSEAAATSKTSGVANTVITNLSKSTTVRLRIAVSNEGGTYYSYAAQQFRIEYGTLITTCANIATWTQVAGGAAWSMSNSANLTDGANTTNIAVATGGVADTNATFISSNTGVKDTSSDTSSLSVSSDSFVELEYSIAAQSSATDGATYCFRVTNAGSATNFQYDVYPQATLAAGSLTFSVDSNTQALPNVTPGTLVATTSILSITTGNNTGFNVTLLRDTAASTMALNTDSAVQIPDKTAWSAPGATTTTGNSSASSTQSQTLQFRVRQSGTDTPNYASVWWGTADTTAAALFAGIPSTAQTVINRSTSAGAGTTAYVLYNLDVPTTQKTGAYSGSVTYTAVANP